MATTPSRWQPPLKLLNATLLVGTSLASGELFAQSKPARVLPHSSQHNRGVNVPAVGEVSAEEATVQLNYFGAPWDKVFREIAEATESELIAERVPSGRYTRRDKTEYTRTEAVRIVNREIEPLGFRIVEKGKFLVVLDLPSVRPKYAPAEINPPRQNDALAAQEQALRQSSTHYQYTQGVTNITPNGRPAAPPPMQNQMQAQAAPQPYYPPQQAAPPAYPPQSFPQQPYAPPQFPPQQAMHRPPAANPLAGNPPAVIQQAAHEATPQPFPAAGSGAAHPLLAEPRPQAAAPVEAEAALSMTYRAQHRHATELAKTLYQLYKSDARLVDSGRNGLPAFSVARTTAPKSAKPGLLQFHVSIDETREELLIDGPTSAAKGVFQTLRLLDTDAKTAETPHVLVTESATCRLVSALEPELDKMVLARQQAQENGEPLGRRRPAAEEGADPAAPAPGQPRRPNIMGNIIGNLKGQVNIESVEDLGVLILRGNEADVEQVMSVIRELEKLSEATAPELHVLYLKHTDSPSMANLLTLVFENLAKFPGRATQPRQNVSIVPVDTPNALIILAPQADLTTILDLAEELDQPTDPETEFQIFPLKTAIADDVVTLLTNYYATRAEGGLGARVVALSDARSNSVIVRARPRDLDEVEAIIRKVDREQTASVNLLRIFPLKNATAAEMAATINGAIQSVLSPPTNTAGQNQGFGGGIGGGQVAEQFRAVRPALLQFLAVDANGERQLRSGMLADIRVTPDSRMNSLVVSAGEQSMALIAELIKQLDVPTSAVAEIKVFSLANADAQQMVTQLQALFSPQQAGGGGGLNNQLRQQLGIAVAGAEDLSSSLIPLRFSVDTRTNSIIAVGGGEALRVVEAILLRLDESDIRERQNTVYKLKNSPAAAVAAAVNQFLNSQLQLAQQNPNLISNIEQLEREVIVVPEVGTNSLLISATPRYFDEIKRLVQQLDEAPKQVIIQALLVEVQLDNTDEFGVELGFQDSVLFDRSNVSALQTITQTTTAPNGVQTTTQQIISRETTPGFNFLNPATPLGNNNAQNANPSDVGTQGLSSFSLGRVNGDLGFGGLVLSAGSESVNVLIRALASRRRVQVLSRPQIRTLDNQLAQIQVGQQVPIVDGVQTNGLGTANPQIRQDQAGIILTVTPRISPDGIIVMELIAEISQFRGDGVPIFTDTTTGNVIESPIKDISSARTAISVPNGQTAVIGGMITKTEENIERKVPWLGDIPVLGYAFRYDSKTHVRTELLMFLTPRIIFNDADAEAIKEVEMGRLHFIEVEAEEVHGPLRAVPGAPVDGMPFDPNCPTPMGGHLITPEMMRGNPINMAPGQLLPSSDVPAGSGPNPLPVPGADPIPAIPDGDTSGDLGVPPAPVSKRVTVRDGAVRQASGTATPEAIQQARLQYLDTEPAPSKANKPAAQPPAQAAQGAAQTPAQKKPITKGDSLPKSKVPWLRAKE